MPGEEAQFERIFKELELLRGEASKNMESLQAQIRSMQQSISANTGEMGQRVTALERDFSGYVDQRELLLEQTNSRFTFNEGGIKEMSLQLGKTQVAVEGLQKLHEQAKGAAQVWKVVAAVGGFALVLVNLYHFIR